MGMDLQTWLQLAMFIVAMVVMYIGFISDST